MTNREWHGGQYASAIRREHALEGAGNGKTYMEHGEACVKHIVSAARTVAPVGRTER